MRGATTQRSSMALPILYFNPRAPCGARPASPPFCGHEWPFQSTRPMRGATQILRCDMAGKVFQSTRPMRGATGNHAQIKQPKTDFNPRAPCGARRGVVILRAPVVRISIHAPHAGRDNSLCISRDRPTDFNPRAPCGARPDTNHDFIKSFTISIHAPHAGRDQTSAELPAAATYFNPRAPCGARPSWLTWK